MPFALWYGRKRANIGYGQRGLSDRVECCDAFSAESRRRAACRRSSSDINGSVIDDTVVQKNCSLHIRGNLLGNLTIESGAKVVVEGSVDGKIINRGGRLVVNNKAHAACVTTDGPAEAEACGVLKIDLTAIVSNWEKLAKYAAAECAAVVKGNAYGCGIEPIAGALAKTGCRTFFVSDIPEAKRVRAVAPNATDLCSPWAVLWNRAGLRRSQCATRHL